MKCLTICEPYALCVSIGLKPIENRTWYTEHRGPLLIHAGKSRQWMDTLSPAAANQLARYCRDRGIIDIRAMLGFGCIVALVDVVDCITAAEARERFRGTPAADWIIGPWCHVYERARRFPYFIAYPGRQGLFEVPDNIVALAVHNATLSQIRHDQAAAKAAINMAKGGDNEQ